MKPHFFSLMVIASLVIGLSGCDKKPKSTYYQPWVDMKELFHEVQMNRVFEDSKTFVDCIPLKNPEDIMKEYKASRGREGFDLKAFVQQNFELPKPPVQAEFEPVDSKARICANCYDSLDFQLYQYLDNKWDELIRDSNEGVRNSTLIPLQGQYIVPGGRFREIYYWDSYFTMIGLEASGRIDLIESMLDNFAGLIETVGFIPNGNRTYYLGRSQPPFFSLMVNLYANVTSQQQALGYLDAIQKEYDYWMAGSEQLTEEQPFGGRVVYLNDSVILNRYWDDFDTPRPESYREDVELASEAPNKQGLYRNLRSGAASGWDYSTRWFEDKEEFASIRTIEMLPVDLNCLLYFMEAQLASFYKLKGDTQKSDEYELKASEREEAIRGTFWNDELGIFTDYLWSDAKLESQLTMASMFPLYFGIATEAQAERMSREIRDKLLAPGGLLTTTIESGQQWDAPNGWAPLQWIGIKGLERYGYDGLSDTIATRWVNINKKVYANTGRMMEKYNVVDTTLLAGGGEYPTQDGFGWTNGVLLGLLAGDPVE
ncbi:alpha,alpha-trehalase TreF [Marinoscillum sp. MHG1-6]|uniref:alpha,alpha-trehalase TreF n=1 Tax=Marinoscillum sp. MHG1-6 TaxID=2959627 RepID=UPI002157E387|nr:alpha,alpha-trehalase TreF [Marinoscillum sp. MHG1-6]